MRAALVLCLALAVPALADEAAPSGDFALSGCRVVTCAGDDVPDGVVVVKDGKIAAVGPRDGTEIPKGVPVVDAAGKVVVPGFVHAGTRLGLRGNGGGGTSTTDPKRTAEHELDPWRAANRWSAANGFTTLGLLPGRGTVGGRGVAVRAAASGLDGMVRREDSVLRVDVVPGARFTSGLAKALASARKEVDAHAKWTRDHAKWEKDKKAAEAAKKTPPKEPKEPKGSDDRAAYRKVLLGETALYCNVGSSADVVALGKALADERVRGEKLRLVVSVSGDAYRSASELADLGATCIVAVGTTSWPNTLDTICPAVYLHQRGVPVVLRPSSDSRDGLRGFRYLLARTATFGFPADAALRAATVDAAAVLGLGEEVGTIAKDRRADLQLYSGDPLLATSRLEQVWIDGVPVEETP